MRLRFPRPFKAIWSLVLAARGDWFELYRVPYKVDETEDVGALVWLEGPDMEPTLVTNSAEIYFDSGRTYVVDKVYKTSVRGETLPVHDLTPVENVANDEDVVVIPDKFLDQHIPPIDRKDEILT